MIKKIAHLADIHIRKIPTRNKEYEGVFKETIKSLKKDKPDRIVIVGDYFHDYIDLQGEQLILASEFLNSLSEIAPVIITRGNHDFRKKAKNRVDSIKALVKIVNNDRITYYGKTGAYVDENVTWMVWHHGERKNPWRTKTWKEAQINNPDNITIDLFHDPVNGCLSALGFEMKKKSYYKLSDFQGNYSFFGDIHKQQFFSNDTKAYPSSLIAQKFDEGDDNFHGYLLWDIIDNTVTKVPINNDYSYHHLKLTTFTDFDDLDYEIDNPTKYMRIRVVWSTLPATRNNENEQIIENYLKSLYPNSTISHKNEFVYDEDDIVLSDDVTIKNIVDEKVQQDIMIKYLSELGLDEKMIGDIIILNDEITSELEIAENTGIEWNVIKFGGNNFMSYETINIDWRKQDGLFQITGENTAGKTTILKLISYILFGKTLETESRIKYGDHRFVNNKTNKDYCNGYLVLDVNGEYFGIKRETIISRNKKKEINGASTKVYYYLLPNPDAEMNDDTSINNLTDEVKNTTQKLIDKIIGTYDNFMRIVMTTSDTLNRILSNDMAVFIDSILADSGLDIFDLKLQQLKLYQKKLNEKVRVSCNIPETEKLIKEKEIKIEELDKKKEGFEFIDIPQIVEKIETGEKYVEDLIKKTYKIDPLLNDFKLEKAQEEIKGYEEELKGLDDNEATFKYSLAQLIETYDEERLKELEKKRDDHKTYMYDQKLKIKEIEGEIRDLEHDIEILNGDIFRLKKDGKDKKDEILNLKNSKTCPTCGQPLQAEHQEHINKEIKSIEVKMYKVGDDIKEKQQKIDALKVSISLKHSNIKTIKKQMEDAELEMVDVLKEIGDLTNQKNDVEKRKEIQADLDKIPLQRELINSKIDNLNLKIDTYNNNLKFIEENEKIEVQITRAKERLDLLKEDKEKMLNDIKDLEFDIKMLHSDITQYQKLIDDFKEQEYHDTVVKYYKKCVHRDGVPRQLLTTHIIPRVNIELEKTLSIAPFKVWLDVDTLRPKLAYYTTPDAVIDAISASGKERTFASVVLKMALNEINVKSKPTIFLLDEVMGKLTENSVEEFVDILHIMKTKYKKLLIIEHMHDVNPDFIIDVERNEDGISNAILN